MTAAVLGDNTNATLGGASDTWIQETAPTANRNADAIVNVTDWTAGDRKRAVLEFPTAGLPAGITISAGATL